LWISIILPLLGALAAAGRYYIDHRERKLSSQLTTHAIEKAEKEALTARSEVADATKKQEEAETALRKLEASAAEATRAKEAFAALQRTPPKIKAYLATSERTGDLLVVMDTENLVPFRARWNIVTKKDRVVAGIMLEGHEIYPTDKQKRFTTKARISGAEVTDEYVELRFRYESIYSAELGNPPELRGEIVQRYRFKDNRVLPWE
jgi:hypothetical protein